MLKLGMIKAVDYVNYADQVEYILIRRDHVGHMNIFFFICCILQ